MLSKKLGLGSKSLSLGEHCYSNSFLTLIINTSSFILNMYFIDHFIKLIFYAQVFLYFCAINVYVCIVIVSIAFIKQLDLFCVIAHYCRGGSRISQEGVQM